MTKRQRFNFDANQPMQPIFIDEDGFARFKPNAVLMFFRDRFSLDEIPIGTFQQDGDLEQFFQLLGYSIVDYDELSFVSQETKTAVQREAYRVRVRRLRRHNRRKERV